MFKKKRRKKKKAFLSKSSVWIHSFIHSLSAGCNQVSGKVLGAGRWGVSKDDDDNDEIVNNYVNVDGNGVAVGLKSMVFMTLMTLQTCFSFWFQSLLVLLL